MIVELAVTFAALLAGVGIGLLWRPPRIHIEKVPPELLPQEVPCPPSIRTTGKTSELRSPFAPRPKLQPLSSEPHREPKPPPAAHRERLMGVFLKAKLERIEQVALPEPPPEPKLTHWPKPPATSRLPSIDWSGKT